MDSRREDWIARSAAAFCVAARWLSLASLALAVLALGCLYLFPTVNMPAAAMLSLVTAAGAVQAYLALRIEFDRRIFEAFAAHPEGAAAAASGFDEAMQSLGMPPKGKAGRTLAERALGALLLVKGAGWIFALQLALAIAAPRLS